MVGEIGPGSPAEFLARHAPRGTVTYGQANAHLPAGVLCAVEIDRLVDALRTAGVDVVRHSPGPRGAPPSNRSSERPGARAAARTADAASPDTVAAYLRNARAIPLLTRDEEVLLAKRIEAGERALRSAAIGTALGLETLLDLGQRLRAGSVRLRDVVRPEPPGDGTAGGEGQPARVLSQIAAVERSSRALDTTVARLGTSRTLAPATRRRLETRAGRLRRRVAAQVRGLDLASQRVEEVAARIVGLAARARRAERTVRRYARRGGPSSAVREADRTLDRVEAGASGVGWRPRGRSWSRPT